VLRCCLRALGSGSVVYIAAASRISRQDAMRGSRSGGFSGALAWYCFDVFFFWTRGREARGPGPGAGAAPTWTCLAAHGAVSEKLTVPRLLGLAVRLCWTPGCMSACTSLSLELSIFLRLIYVQYV
jgi:hypothetical protein